MMHREMLIFSTNQLKKQAKNTFWGDKVKVHTQHLSGFLQHNSCTALLPQYVLY